MRQDFTISEARATMETTVEGCDNAVLIVSEFPEIDYVLAYRNSKYMPWVAAWCYKPEHNSWGQGHYFETIEDAMTYIIGLHNAKAA